MGEMKQAEIDHALREVAKQRDKMLGKVPAISSARRTALIECLVAEFPMESALREAAKRRDQLLVSCPAAIPSAVESALHGQLWAAKAAGGTRKGHASHWTITASIWRKIFRSPLAAVLTACAMIALAFLCLGRWGSPVGGITTENVPETARENLAPGAILDRPWIDRAELFSRRIAIGPFNLNTNERASLQTSFAAPSRIQFPDGIETPLGLRLDLPVSATLLEDNLPRTP